MRTIITVQTTVQNQNTETKEVKKKKKNTMEDIKMKPSEMTNEELASFLEDVTWGEHKPDDVFLYEAARRLRVSSCEDYRN